MCPVQHTTPNQADGPSDVGAADVPVAGNGEDDVLAEKEADRGTRPEYDQS